MYDNFSIINKICNNFNYLMNFNTKKSTYVAVLNRKYIFHLRQNKASINLLSLSSLSLARIFNANLLNDI